MTNLTRKELSENHLPHNARYLVIVLGFLMMWESPILPYFLGVEDFGRQVLMGMFQFAGGFLLIMKQLCEKGDL